jgi:hypothetical protein
MPKLSYIYKFMNNNNYRVFLIIIKEKSRLLYDFE